MYIEAFAADRDRVLQEKESENSFLKVQLKALQNYITTLIVERD